MSVYDFWNQTYKFSNKLSWLIILKTISLIGNFITTKFQEILLSGFRGDALTNCFRRIFHYGQIFKFKKVVTPRKKIESKFPVDMRIYTFLHNYKFHEILLSGFRGVAVTRKIGLTDWLTDGPKTLYPPQLVAGDINI